MRKYLTFALIGSLLFVVVSCSEEDEENKKTGVSDESTDERPGGSVTTVYSDNDLETEDLEFESEFVYVKSEKITSEAKITPYKYVGENAIGIGWYPYYEPEKRRLYFDASFYAEPSIDAEVIAELPKGTELEISGDSAIRTRFMSPEKWNEHVYSMTDADIGIVRPTLHWCRAEYNGTVGWIHGSRFRYSMDELLGGWCPMGGFWGQELILDNEMKKTGMTLFGEHDVVDGIIKPDRWFRYYLDCRQFGLIREDIKPIPRNEIDKSSKSGFYRRRLYAASV